MFVTKVIACCCGIRQCTITSRNQAESRNLKEALQWRSERRAQVQSCVNHTELTSELNLQYSWFTLSKRHIHSKNDWLAENWF